MIDGLTKNYGQFDVSITKHALRRMVQRNIYREGVVQIILKVISTITDKENKIIIIFKDDNFSLVIKKEQNTITIITAIRGCYESRGSELHIAV